MVETRDSVNMSYVEQKLETYTQMLWYKAAAQYYGGQGSTPQMQRFEHLDRYKNTYIHVDLYKFMSQFSKPSPDFWQINDVILIASTLNSRRNSHSIPIDNTL